MFHFKFSVLAEEQVIVGAVAPGWQIPTRGVGPDKLAGRPVRARSIGADLALGQARLKTEFAIDTLCQHVSEAYTVRINTPASRVGRDADARLSVAVLTGKASPATPAAGVVSTLPSPPFLPA